MRVNPISEYIYSLFKKLIRFLTVLFAKRNRLPPKCAFLYTRRVNKSHIVPETNKPSKADMGEHTDGDGRSPGGGASVGFGRVLAVAMVALAGE